MLLICSKSSPSDWLARFDLNAGFEKVSIGRPMRLKNSSEVSVIFAEHETSDKDLTQCNNDLLYTCY